MKPETVKSGVNVGALVGLLVVGALVGVYAWGRFTSSGFYARLMSSAAVGAVRDALVNAPGSGGV